MTGQRAPALPTMSDAPPIRPLTLEDAPRMARLEAAAWPGPLQAGEGLVRERLALGHTILAAEIGGEFAGAACFVFTREDPHDAERFPRTFEAFSSLPRSAPALSLYVYNLCIHPAHRGTALVRRIIDAVVQAGRAEGARWLVGDGRCPSYAGSFDGADHVRANPDFARAVDEWATRGQKPPARALTGDPVLRFYHRLLDCEFLHLMPAFLPADLGSGGYRVIFAKDLRAPA